MLRPFFPELVMSTDLLSFEHPSVLGTMYRGELVIKDTTESNTSASYLDLRLSIGMNGQLRTSL